MKTSFFALAVGLAGVFATMPSVRAAQPELYFYPSGAWAVGLSELPGTKSNVQNCAIRSEFNNGFVMQIDGSDQWVETLNINFRQKAFEKGKTYKVRASLPGGPKQDLTGFALGDNLISLSLSSHKEFYKSMRDASALDLTIEGNEFRFYMLGFQNAAKDFETCMAGGIVKQASASGAREVVRGDNAALDPAKNMAINEAIAFEQAEFEQVPITEIIPENQPVNIVDERQTRTRAIDEIAAQIEEDPGIIATDPAHSSPPPPIDTGAAQQSLTPEPQSSSRDLLRPPVYGERADMREANGDINITRPETVESASASPVEKEMMEEISVAAAPAIPAASSGFEGLDTGDSFVRPIGLESEIDKMPATRRLEAAAQDIRPAEAAESQKRATGKASPKETILTNNDPEFPGMVVTREKQSAEADFSSLGRVEPSAPSTVQEAVTSDTINSDLMAKVNALQAELEALSQENKALNDELDLSLSESREERSSIATGDWNLERATMRFNEAERQLKLLGQKLQRERTQCSMEKKELEAMLFDPQVTQQEQLVKLAEMESQLADAQQKLEDQRQRMQERIAILEEQLRAR